MQLCFVVSHCLFLFKRFIYLYAVLHHMMHWDWYFMYTSHQYRIYLHICHFELVYTRTNVWNQFPLFRGCGVRPQFTFCVYSNLSISSWPESQTETSQQHSLLVLTPRPSIALVSPQCALYVRSARVSSECARFYRAQIIILRHFTAHESFSFVLCANN